MTNREIIQLFAKYEPELIAECFDDCCCLGYEHISVQYFTKDWLDAEYSNDFFREQDVERLLKKESNTVFVHNSVAGDFEPMHFGLHGLED